MSFDDKDFDDDALWALMDSAASAASLSSKPRKTCQPLTPVSYPSPKTLAFPSKSQKPNPSLSSRSLHSNSYGSAYSDRGEVVQHEPQPSDYCYRTPPPPLIPQRKIARSGTIGDWESREVTPLSVARRSGGMLSVASPEVYVSPGIRIKEEKAEEGMGIVRHSLAGRFPSVSLFKEYQNAAMEILEKSDYTMISGHPFIKKSGWRKISFYFNLSYEIRDKTIEFDEKRDVQRAEFIVRAYMQGGRFSDGWGSCERREKRFNKPNHDIPSTAETRAKNKACQDLLGIGEYRPGISNVECEPSPMRQVADWAKARKGQWLRRSKG